MRKHCVKVYLSFLSGFLQYPPTIITRCTYYDSNTMADDHVKSQTTAGKMKQDSQHIAERPLDPTRDAEDFLGDPTGRTGVTTGDPRQISAEPDEVDKDTSVLRGGEVEDPTHSNPTGIPEEDINDAVYDKKVLQGMSNVRIAVNDDLASEEENPASRSESGPDTPVDFNYDADFSKDMQNSDHGSGEDNASGTTSDPESDDDVGNMMARVTGHDPDPNMDNPQELGIAEEIDEDEDAHLHT
jgi:hypothetical protein